MKREARKLLKTVYGYEDFRRGQEIIIDSVLEKRDTLGIMSTGGGKSICYQIPALIFKGLTIVISPLISLMKDQVDSLRLLGVKSVCLNSAVTRAEYLDNVMKIKRGEVKLIYVSPEKLQSKSFINFIRRFKVSLVAVDEAHCISQWGHDFRKSYLEIPEFIKELKQNIQIVALTATATRRVREDIIDKLQMKDPFVHVDGFDRENIFFRVERYLGDTAEQDKFAQQTIADYIMKHGKKPGIIYAATRKEVDNLHAYLALVKKIPAVKYHAGMPEDERKENQEKFLNDEVHVMVATNAFGMGIDKSNVRYVIHRNIPKDMESYYQEAGRGGRDGGPAEAILLFFDSDIGIQKHLIENNDETSDEFKEEKFRKLDAMIDYAHLESCYREYILKYFGEKRIKNYCGNCGNCKTLKDVEDLTIDTQKVLSCVGRAGEKIGVSTLINILSGRADTKMKRKGYQNLSTFAIMNDRELPWIEEFVNFLLSEGYMEHSAGSFPVLKLNDKSWEVLDNKITVYRRKNEKVSYDYFDDPLYEGLTQLRAGIAHEENVPPYVVFSDVTLLDMAELKPVNRWEMLKIRGVGNQKFKNYGKRFIELIKKYTDESQDNITDYGMFSDDVKINEFKEHLDTEMETEDLKRLLYNIFLK